MSTIFRDPTEGATARREDLLRRRRDELVVMPHAIRRVYVSRRARAAASIVVCVAGAAMLVTAATPSLARWFAGGMPGVSPAVLSTLVIAMWLAGVFTYAFARAFDEHRFSVAMSHYVMPSKDLANDIERLSHEHPDQAAREMAHRLEVRSAALPVLAASVLLPVTMLYLVQAVQAHGWPVIAEFESNVATHAKLLIGFGIAGVATSIAMTRRFARMPSVSPIAGVAAFVGLVASLVSWQGWAAAALIVATVAIVVRRLDTERGLLETVDQAAGSELFTIRGMIRSAGGLLRAVGGLRRYLTKRSRRIAVLATVVVVAGWYPSARREHVTTAARVEMPHARPHMTPATANARATTNDRGSSYRIEPMGDGRLRIEVVLVDDAPLDIEGLAGLTVVPHGWSARVTIEYGGTWEYSDEPILEVTFGGSPDGVMTLRPKQKTVFSVSACKPTVQPLSLRVRGATTSHTLFVKPVLEPAACD